MKKLMTALAVCLAAGFVSASGGGVVSSNVVGYVKNQVDGIDLLGFSFRNMVSIDGTWTLNTQSFGVDLQDNDVVQVFDASWFDYVTYQYAGGSWLRIDPDLTVTDPVPAPVFAVGDAVLFTPAAGSISTIGSGEVPQGVFTNKFLSGAITFFTSKIPVAVTVGEFAAVAQDNDAVLVWDASWFDFITYQFSSGNALAIYPDLTINPSVPSATIMLPVGKGAFYQSGGGGDVEFVQSLSL